MQTISNPSIQEPKQKERPRVRSGIYSSSSFQTPVLPHRHLVLSYTPPSSIRSPCHSIQRPLCSCHLLTTILGTLATVRTALAALLTHETTAQRRQASCQAAAVLLLLGWRALLVLGLLLLIVHLLLRGRSAVLHGRALVVLGLGWAVAGWKVSGLIVGGSFGKREMGGVGNFAKS